jgi:hypothetical protein
MAAEPIRARYRPHLNRCVSLIGELFDNNGNAKMTHRQVMLIEMALVTLIITPVIFCFCVLTITYDVHQTRIEQASMLLELKRDTLRRVDALLWKADSGLEIAGAFKSELGLILTKLRAQVKQASDENTKVSRIETHETTRAVAQAIQRSTETAIAITKSETPEPETPKADKPITVNVPPPVIVTPSVPVGSEEPKKETIAPPQKRRWWVKLFVWRR